MEDIAQETGETVLLTRLSGQQAICIARVEGQQNVRITFAVGEAQPLHAGASSKILLAYLNDDWWDRYLVPPLEAFTEFTVTDASVLKEQLRQIRHDGFCVSDSEVDVGAKAVSVPIFNKKQQAVAALSTAGPSFRMVDAVVEKHLDLLQKTAVEIQDQLTEMGYFASIK